MINLVREPIHYKEEINIAQQIVEKLEQNSLAVVIDLLNQLIQGEEFCSSWLRATKLALQTRDWGLLSQGFINREFIGINGYFLLIAPHQLSREKGSAVHLSAVLGKIIQVNSVSSQQLEDQILRVFGTLLEPVPELIPFICIKACGHFGNEDSEALITPEAWSIPNSLQGPIINNLTQHRKRYNQLVKTNILRIFESETASLLLDSLVDENAGTQLQQLEYQYHEGGHAAGLGIKHKIAHNLLPSYWHGGVEEWRSDSVEFALAMGLHSIEEVGKLIAANFCLRFGIDAQREGACGFDTHANSSLILLEYLFRREVLFIENDRLTLDQPSYKNLVEAVDIQCAEAITLTKQELTLTNTKEALDCYRSIKVHSSTKEIFRKYVMEPSFIHK